MLASLIYDRDIEIPLTATQARGDRDAASSATDYDYRVLTPWC